MNHKCSKLRQSKRATDNSDLKGFATSWMEKEDRRNRKQKQLEPNQIKEMTSACPFYFGEEMSMHAPTAFRNKKFNPIIDMIDARIEKSTS